MHLPFWREGNAIVGTYTTPGHLAGGPQMAEIEPLLSNGHGLLEGGKLFGKLGVAHFQAMDRSGQFVPFSSKFSELPMAQVAVENPDVRGQRLITPCLGNLSLETLLTRLVKTPANSYSVNINATCRAEKALL